MDLLEESLLIMNGDDEETVTARRFTTEMILLRRNRMDRIIHLFNLIKQISLNGNEIIKLSFINLYYNIYRYNIYAYYFLIVQLEILLFLCH
jgi:hypothetical protein